MPRKEQITITIDSQLVGKLREHAKRNNASLSSVIESCLKSVDAMAGKTDIQRVLEILGDIKSAIREKEEEELSSDSRS